MTPFIRSTEGLYGIEALADEWFVLGTWTTLNQCMAVWLNGPYRNFPNEYRLVRYIQL